MSRPSSLFAVQSGASRMVSSLSDGVVDGRFPSTKKISVLLDDANYLLWRQQILLFEQQDRALASWLLSSISPGVLPHLIGLDTSAQLWNAIVDLYGIKIKGYCAGLASCGEPISDHEHVTAILNVLPPEYESVIAIVTANSTPYTVQGVTTILLDAEVRQLSSTYEVPTSANVVTHSPPRSDDKAES
ncbi:hypothetical protein CXB51_025338 [Gossypium anomalum]|uniref:Uncharacterized protein n=1 Tax=Gossypium anomalum TaxID=47600 RepID=A0A8J6CM76_9ROSI|nr:hypothetical protein CXB51_025338 [Gossypium anomalum]